MLLFAIILLTFLAVALLVWGLASPTAARTALERRLDAIANSPPEPSSLPNLAQAGLDLPFAERVLRPALRRLAALTARLTPRGAAQAVRVLLDRAGIGTRFGVAEFLGLRALSLFVFLLLALGSVSVFGDTPQIKLIALGLCLVIGAVLPDAMLQRRIAARQAQIQKSIADTVDLLIVSVEAGMSFDGALARVVEKVGSPLSQEFGRVLQEMRLGKARGTALKDMAARVGLPEIKTLVAAIYQADHLGVGIANVLRVQSATIRVARAQQIREMAAKLPVQMLFPLIFFIFPAIFIVLLGPGLITILKSFANF